MRTADRAYPDPPAELRELYAVLGRAHTIRFLLTFGGAELYIATTPRPSSRVAQLVGMERAAQLGAIRDRLPARVPLCKPWIARVMHADGASVSTIARTLHNTDTTVRRWLRDGRSEGEADQ